MGFGRARESAGARASAQEEVFRRFDVRAGPAFEADALRALFEGALVREVWETLALVFIAGSPVAAFSTSPPSARAISDRRRFETAERGISSATSTLLEANSSRCLIKSQEVLELLP
jgi:hypothetical protein